MPPTPCSQRTQDRFVPSADNFQLSAKIIFARFDPVCFGVPTIVTGANARDARLRGPDPLKIKIQPIFFHDIVVMKDENPFVVLAKSLERGIDRATLPKLLLIPQDRKLRHSCPRFSRQLGRVVRTSIIADKHPTQLRNTGTRLNSTQRLDNCTSCIKG